MRGKDSWRMARQHRHSNGPDGDERKTPLRVKLDNSPRITKLARIAKKSKALMIMSPIIWST
jgi:hypothetical protein